MARLRNRISQNPYRRYILQQSGGIYYLPTTSGRRTINGGGLRIGSFFKQMGSKVKNIAKKGVKAAAPILLQEAVSIATNPPANAKELRNRMASAGIRAGKKALQQAFSGGYVNASAKTAKLRGRNIPAKPTSVLDLYDN